MGDKIQSLNTTLATEREKWVNAIRLSKITAQQQKKSKGGLTKNISLIISIFDKEVAILNKN